MKITDKPERHLPREMFSWILHGAGLGRNFPNSATFLPNKKY